MAFQMMVEIVLERNPIFLVLRLVCTSSTGGKIYPHPYFGVIFDYLFTYTILQRVKEFYRFEFDILQYIDKKSNNIQKDMERTITASK